MQFMLMLFEDETIQKNMTQEEQGALFGAYAAYSAALQEAGAFVGGEPLELSDDAAVLRVRQEKRGVQDGPFIEAKEQLGGFYIIEAPDLAAAQKWAAKCPCAETGYVEIRPVLEMGH